MDCDQLIDVRQTPQYASYMKKNGWIVSGGDKQSPYQYSKSIPFTPFKITKVLRYHPSGKAKISQPKNCKIFKDEPFIFQTNINTLTFKKESSELVSGPIYFHKNKNNSWPVTPTKTVWINLADSLQIIKQKLKAKTRYNLKRSQTKFNLSTKIIPGNKIDQTTLHNFYSLWSQNKPHSFLFRPSKKQLTSLISSFYDKCFIITATVNTKSKHYQEIQKQPIISSALILTTPNMSFYWYNASTDLGKELFAPTKIIWQAIKESKKRKLTFFDLEGVWDERFPKLNQGWKGFSRFKHSFVRK